MTDREVVVWDCTMEGPAEPETWIQVCSTSMKVCGGLPNVVASDGTDLYRHTPNGMLWRLQAAPSFNETLSPSGPQP